MKTYYLIGCGKSKLDRVAPVRELYTGALFRKSLAYARCHNPSGMRTLVLSAKLGAVSLDHMAAPYDCSMRDLSRTERAGWAFRTARALYDRGALLVTDRFVVLAGLAYVRPLQPYLRHIVLPLGSLGIGQRMAWLDREAAAFESTSTAV